MYWNDDVWWLVGLKWEPLYERRVSHVVRFRSGRSYWIRKPQHKLAAFDFVQLTPSVPQDFATSPGPTIPRGVSSHSRLHFVHVSIPLIISSLPLSINLFASLFLCQSSVFHTKLNLFVSSKRITNERKKNHERQKKKKREMLEPCFL